MAYEGIVRPGLSDSDRNKYKTKDNASYTFYDMNGNEVGSGRMKSSVDPRSVQHVYKQDDGSYSNVEPTSSSITINNKGHITVTAPSYVLEREGFKEGLEQTLKTLSRYYKADPNYAVPMKDGSTKTVTELLGELNDPNNKDSIVAYTESVNNMRKQEYGDDESGYEGDRKTYKIGDNITLDDNYFILRNAIALGSDVKDDTRQAISDLPEFAFLRALDTYDSATGTAQLKDIMENGWNRDKHSDDELKAAKQALERYFARGDYSDTEQLAKNIATYEFITGRHPDVAFWRNVGETAGSAVEGAWNFFVDVGGYIVGGSIAEANNMIANATIDIMNFFGADGQRGYQPGYGNGSKDIIQKGYKEHVLDYWEDYKKERQDDRNLLSGTQAAAVDLSYGITKLVTLIAVGNAMSNGLQTFAANVEAGAALGAQVASEGLTLSTASLLKNGFTTFLIASTPSAAAAMANLISVVTATGAGAAIIGLIGETFGESITANPKLFYEVLMSKDLTEDAKNQLIEDFVGNTFGVVSGVYLSKAMIKVGQTATGRALSHNFSRKLYQFQNFVHKNANKLRIKVHQVDDMVEYVEKLMNTKNGRKLKKADAVSIDEMIYDARKAVAESDPVKIVGRSKDEILADLDSLRVDTMNLLDLENAIDEMRRHGRGILSEWYSSGEYKTFQAATKNFDDAYEALYKAEKVAGDAVKLRHVGKLAISQESANYVQGVTRLAIIDSMIENAPKNGIELSNIAGMRKEREELVKMIAEYANNATPQMKAAADALVEANRKWYTEANNLLVKEGLLSDADIAAKRASGMWGENGELYIHTVREHHLEGIRQQRFSFIADGTIQKPYKYSFGKNDDFLDPLATSRLYMSQYADKLARQQTVRAYINISGAKNSELLDAAQTRAARIVNDGVMTASRNEADSLIGELAKEIRATGAVDDFAKQVAATDELGKAVRSSDSAAEALQKEIDKPVSEYKATSQNMSAGVQSMSNEEVDEIWRKKMGDTSVKQYAVENKSKLPRSTKANIEEEAGTYRYAKVGDVGSDTRKRRQFVSERVSKVLEKETGYPDIESWTESEEFAKMSNLQRKKVLAKIYGEKRADEIMEAANDYHGGDLPASADKSVPNEERIAEYQAKKQAIKEKIDAAIKRRREKYEPYIMREKYADLVVNNNTDQATRRMLEMNALANEKDPLGKIWNTKAKVNAEDIDLAIEVRNVKKLRKIKRQGGKLSRQDKLLLAKWEGKQYPRFSKGTENLIKKLDRYEAMSDFPTDLKRVVKKGKATAEEMQMAIADVEYGSGVGKASMFSDTREQLTQEYLGDVDLTGELYDELAAWDPDFEQSLKRSIISHDKEFREMEEVQNAGRQYAHNKAVANKMKRLGQRNVQLGEASEVAAGKTEQVRSIVESKVEDVISKMGSRPATSRAYKELAIYYGIDEDVANRYFTLRSICDPEHKSHTSKMLFQQFKNELRQLKIDDVNDVIARRFTREFMSSFQDEYDSMRVVLQETAPELVDQRGIYNEVRQIASQAKILNNTKRTVVALQDSVGEVSFVETSPLVANLLNYQNLPGDMGALQKANYLMSKMFRLGTTGVRITSIVNQTFRDFGNAFIGGNLYRTWSKCVDEMREVLGDGVVDWIDANDHYFAEYIRKAAAETGEDVNDVAYEAIKKYGMAISPEATETAVYRHAGDVQVSIKRGKLKGIDTLGDRGFGRTNRAIDKLEEWLGKPNEFRERGLRNAVFRNSFADAVKRGYSYADAKTWATFAMNNATTNFGRATKMFSNLQDSVPFLGAAINGTKSFWRLFSVDPVGVMGRLVGGIIMPTMALTAYSLHDEKNREAWKNLAEYQKDDNLVFIVDGQILSVPLPQELSALINPFRHLVEKTYDSNRHAYWELAINDIIGFSPIDLDGFQNIDAYTLSDGTSQDNFFISNIAPGMSKLFSQLAPVPLKTAAMWMTGIDPYTMKPIDRSYTTIDPDTGETVIMNDYSGELGKIVAGNFKGTPFEMSPAMAEKLLGSIFGKAPVDYAGWLIELGQGVFSGDKAVFDERMNSIGEGLFEAATDPLYIEQYRTAADADWKNYVSKMYTRKEELLNSDEWQSYMKIRREATTPEDLAKAKIIRENLLNPYYEDLKKAVENLKSQYGAEVFTAEKYASVISLSVMDQTGVDVSAYGQEMLDELYTDAKQQAVHTMYKLGFQSPMDYSAFGYITTNSKGETYVAESTPMAILDVRNAINGAGDLHYANLKSLLDSNGLNTSGSAYRAMSDQVDKIYSKKKLTNSDYKKINEFYKKWDAQVMSVLYPYISRYGIESVTGHADVIDLLDNVIKVPSDYEVNKKGYYFSAPRMNKQRGFAQSYIKYLYEHMGGK